MRADPYPMTKKISQALHDGETEAEPAAAFARGIIDLIVFPEDRLKLLVRDTDSCVPDLNAKHSFAPTATEQHFAATGVFQCIGKHVADHLFEQTGIAVYRKAARDYA